MKVQLSAEARQKLNQERKALLKQALKLPDGEKKKALQDKADKLLAQINEGGLSGDDAQALALTYTV